MLKKLRLKFVCINMLMVVAMLCVIFGLIYSSTRQNLEDENDKMIRELLSVPIMGEKPGEKPKPGQKLKAGDNTGLVSLPYFTAEMDRNGTLIAFGDGSFDLSDEEYLRSLIELAQQQSEDSGILCEYNLRYGMGESPLGKKFVFLDISSEKATLRNLLQNCIAIAVVSFFAFLGISVYLSCWAIRPVEKAWNQQRQFVGDASHELKTPLTVILTNAELLQNPSYEPEARNQFADNILVMARRMRGLVENLLDLARVDNGVVKTAMERLDFSQLVQDAVLPFEPLYFEQQKTLNCQLESAIMLQGSAIHLRQVVDILLDNALKYSGDSATVSVLLRKNCTHCMLSVASPGTPIPKEKLTRIFERFYREDQARAMNQSYGLGLSIAEGIVREHRGKIWAESNSCGNTFFVQLPL